MNKTYRVQQQMADLLPNRSPKMNNYYQKKKKKKCTDLNVCAYNTASG